MTMIRRWRAVLATTTVLTLPCGLVSARSAEGPIVLAQSGSYGGTIGQQDKSMSGDEPAPRRAPPRSYREPAPRASRAPRYSYDGAWSVQGIGQNCVNNAVSAVVISQGRVVTQGATGTVSPSGAVRIVGASGSVTFTSQGQLSGQSGVGTYRQSDGCYGRWIASKQ